MKRFFITGIGTDVGKTLFSAILTEAILADYWKPIQAGGLNYTDTDFVRQHIDNTNSRFHAEKYLLKTPASPHWAAQLDEVIIEFGAIQMPTTHNHLVIEGAGGVLAPINEKELVIDLIQQFNIPVIIVSKNYLGSINHTLLAYEALHKRNIPIAGIVFNGATNEATETFILQYTQLPCLLRIAEETMIDKSVIKKYARLLRNNLSAHQLI